MCPLSDRTSPSGISESQVKNRYFDPVDSWSSDSEDIENYNKKIIKAINEKYSLLNALKRYNIDIRKVSDYNDWSHHARCPFSDHRDSSPSFGYNSKEDRFYCFGCRRSGRAVEFISFLESLPRIEIAKKLLLELKISEEELFLDSDLDLEVVDSNKEINDSLFEFSYYINDLYHQYKNNQDAVRYIGDVVYTLDMYLNHSVPNNRINLSELKARINKCKEVISLFEDHE